MPRALGLENKALLQGNVMIRGGIGEHDEESQESFSEDILLES